MVNNLQLILYGLCKIKDCVKDIRQWMPSSFLLLDSDKAEELILGVGCPGT